MNCQVLGCNKPVSPGTTQCDLHGGLTFVKMNHTIPAAPRLPYEYTVPAISIPPPPPNAGSMQPSYDYPSLGGIPIAPTPDGGASPRKSRVKLWALIVPTAILVIVIGAWVYGAAFLPGRQATARVQTYCD